MSYFATAFSQNMFRATQRTALNQVNSVWATGARNFSTSSVGRVQPAVFQPNRSFAALNTFHRNLQHPVKVSKLKIPDTYTGLVAKKPQSATNWNTFLTQFVGQKNKTVDILNRIDQHKVRYAGLCGLSGTIAKNIADIRALFTPPPSDLHDTAAEKEALKAAAAKFTEGEKKMGEKLDFMFNVADKTKNRFYLESVHALEVEHDIVKVDSHLNHSILGINEFFRGFEGKKVGFFESFFVNSMGKRVSANSTTAVQHLVHLDVDLKPAADECEAVLKEIQATVATLADYKKAAKEQKVEPEEYLNQVYAKLDELNERLHA